jgi:hypothetical protein
MTAVRDALLTRYADAHRGKSILACGCGASLSALTLPAGLTTTTTRHTYNLMNTTKNLFAAIVALIILGAIAAGLWFGVAYLVQLAGSTDWLSTPDPMLLLSFAVLLAAFAVSSSLRWAKRQEAEHQTREARRGVYESTVLAWRGALRASQELGGAIASRLPEDIHAFEGVLASRASSTVLHHYGQLRQLCSQPDPPPEQVQDQLFSLIMEIRRELGVGGHSPNERTALRSFLMNPRTEKELEIQPIAPSEPQPPSLVAAARPAFSLGK